MKVMVFEKNKPVAETTEEEEILSQTGKKDKNVRMYGFYICSILIRESSEDKRYTCKKLIQRVMEEYKVQISLSTIQNIINNLKQSNTFEKLYGGPKRGYYFESEQQVLDDIEINMIAQLLRNSTIIPFNSKKTIVDKLKYMASDNLCNFFDKYLLIPKEEKQNGLYNLFAEDMIRILTEQRPIIIELKESNQQETIEFNTYYVFSNDRDYELVGAQKNSDKAMIINFCQIQSYKVLENKTFKKKPLKVDKLCFQKNVLQELKTFPKTFLIESKCQVS